MKLLTCHTLMPSLCAAALLVAPGCDASPELDPGTDTDTDGSSDTNASTTGSDTAFETDGEDESGSTGSGDCANIEQADVEDDLLLPAGCYTVDTPLFLQGTTLTMEPGVDVLFASSAGLNLAGGAVLSAVGTADDPVVLHGETEDPASWSGLSFLDAPSSDNRLEYTMLEGAGSVSVSANSRLAVVSSELRGSEDVGLEADDGAEITISGSTFANHDRALSVGYSGAPGIAADNTFTDNEQQAVLVTGNTLTDAATWSALAVPWELANRVSLNAALTLEPGATVMVRQDQSILVTTDGQLNATGTAEAPITFTGAQQEVGYWVGIEFASNSSNNVLEHTVVAYAGGGDWYGGGDAAAALYVPAEGRLTLRNVTLSRSAWYGLLAGRDATLGDFSGVSFADSQRAMKIAVDLGGMIPADTGFENIAEPVVNIGFGNNDRVRTAQSWAALSIPWQATTRFSVETDWTLEAGLVFWGAQDSEFIIEVGGSLHVAGTPNNLVTLGAPEQVAGFWKGIAVRSTSAENLIENAVIEHAGSSGWYGGSDREAAVNVGSDGILELDGVTIRQSAGNGVLNNGTISCAGMTFEAIAKDDYVSDGGTGTCG